MYLNCNPVVLFVMINLIKSVSYFFWICGIFSVSTAVCGSSSIYQIWQRQANLSCSGWWGVFTSLCWDSHKPGRVNQNPLALTQRQQKGLLLEAFLCMFELILWIHMYLCVCFYILHSVLEDDLIVLLMVHFRVRRCKGGTGVRGCVGRGTRSSELVRCMLTAHIRSPFCLIPAIVKPSAMSRSGVTVNTRGSRWIGITLR